MSLPVKHWLENRIESSALLHSFFPLWFPSSPIFPIPTSVLIEEVLASSPKNNQNPCWIFRTDFYSKIQAEWCFFPVLPTGQQYPWGWLVNRGGRRRAKGSSVPVRSSSYMFGFQKIQHKTISFLVSVHLDPKLLQWCLCLIKIKLREVWVVFKTHLFCFQGANINWPADLPHRIKCLWGCECVRISPKERRVRAAFSFSIV